MRVGLVTQPHAAVCRRQQRLGMRRAPNGDAARARFANASAASGGAAGGGGGGGWAADQFRTMHGVDFCACVCAAMLEEVAAGLRALRPHAIVTVRDADTRVGALARLALAPRASLCVTSSFCMWPVLASRRGYLVELGAFPKARGLAGGGLLPQLRVLPAEAVVRYSKGHGVACDTSAGAVEKMRQWARLVLRAGETAHVPYDPPP